MERIRERLLFIVSGCFLFLFSTALAANALTVIDHTFDRSEVFADHYLYPPSTGESLADLYYYQGPPPHETVTPDILVDVLWSDGTTASALWGGSSNKSLLPNHGAVLYPDFDVPGVSFNFSVGQDIYSAFVEQSGSTYSMPWELRNLSSSTYAIEQVIFSARGTQLPSLLWQYDMGFDTDAGDNPGNGELGFTLFVHDILNQWEGNLNVHYDWFNNWNGTTDMFHRMTLNFGLDSFLAPGTSFVYYQDTDELLVPEPGTLALLSLGLGIAFAFSYIRRRRNQ